LRTIRRRADGTLHVKEYDLLLLDGRNRLDAMELVGIRFKIAIENGQCWLEIPDVDRKVFPARDVDDEWEPYAYVISANIHRRHLTAEQKRELIAKLIKATPQKSDRQIAETVKASPTTVGTLRRELQSSTVQSGQLPTKRVGKDGKSRKQPASTPRKKPESGQRVISAEARKAAYAAEEQQLDNVAKHADFIPPTEEVKSTLYCSFCGKSQHDVRVLAQSPNALICDECVAFIVDVDPIQAVVCWKRWSKEQRSKFFSAIKIEEILEAIPEEWRTKIQIDITPPATPADLLDMPAFLRRSA
jgi:hypothetical protein